MIIYNIAVHEIRRMLLSPFAWILLAVVQFLLAMFFLIILNQYLQIAAPNSARGLTDIVVAGMLQIAGFVLLLVTPFLTMRSFSDELRSGTFNLLLASPVSLYEIVLGKYFGLLGFLFFPLCLISLMPLALVFGTNLDFGQLAAAIIGLALLMSALAAIGLFISSLTQHPALAAIITFGVIFVLWVIHIAGNTSTERIAPVFNYLSLLQHYNNLLTGMFSSADVIYFMLLIVMFVTFSIWRLDAMRTYH